MSTADGVLVIDKPAGPTSHDIVARVRRALGTRRVGHIGTLDPLATGVLPLVLGRATRLARFLSAGDKEYEAVVRLGDETDTGDAMGRLAGRAAGNDPAALLDRPRIEAALARWTGTYEQTPPAWSAKKIGGVRAYALARRGTPVEPRPVTVTAFRLELRETDVEAGTVRLVIACSAGFYVRALARDLGRDLQTGGYLVALRRTRAGPFGADVAVPLELVEREGVGAAPRITGVDCLLGDLPAVVLPADAVRRATHGQDVEGGSEGTPGGDPPGGVHWRLVDEAGRLIAVAEKAARPGFLHPVVVVV